MYQRWLFLALSLFNQICHLKKSLFLLVVVCGFHAGFGQVSPPGLGIAHTAEWFALGVKTPLNTSGSWQSLSYLGLGRKSNPDEYDPVRKSAITVLNQEFYHQLKNRFQYSFALSYRRQDAYAAEPPFKHEEPAIEQEFRLYGRLYYTIPLHAYRLAFVYRQELRKFFTPDFSPAEESFQFRSRFRVQLSRSLDDAANHKLIAGAEMLLANSRETAAKKWSGLAYTEARFTFYYSVKVKNSPLQVDIGYMNNLIGTIQLHDVHYIAADLIVNLPRKPSGG